MADSYFMLLDESAETGRYVAGPATVGPWAATQQHGGPPNALAVAAAERIVRAETGREDFLALRLAAEFLGPVPVDEIDTRARIVRAARSAALVEITVSGGGRECVHARVWFVRAADTSTVSTPLPAPLAVVPDGLPGLDFAFPFGDSLEWRFVRGQMHTPGPGAAWVRAELPLVEGYEFSGLARTVMIADAASGVSSVLDWRAWSFVNVDLDIHLARPFQGDWLLVDAVTQIGAHGSALARSTLSDIRGEVGAGLQTLVVAPVLH